MIVPAIISFMGKGRVAGWVKLCPPFINAGSDGLPRELEPPIMVSNSVEVIHHFLFLEVTHPWDKLRLTVHDGYCDLRWCTALGVH